MIVVREIAPNTFERVKGNPTLVSLDGKVKAPLKTILHPSWSDEERARFGVYVLEPFTVPEGRERIGSPKYQRDGNGRVVEIYETQAIPQTKDKPNLLVSAKLSSQLEELHTQLKELHAQLEELAKRIEALESKQ